MTTRSFVGQPRRVVPLLLLLILPAMWPFLSHGGYWLSDDGLLHLYRLFSLEEAWRQGHLYPRLFPDFAFGYGFSVLNFYGPLSYYLALWLRALVGDSLLAMRLTYALSYPAAALAMWWLARDLWRRSDGTPDERAGLLAALTYTYVPYHIANVQYRGALAESWAMVWWPLLLWAIGRGRWWPLVLAATALILTHNLSVLLIAPVALLWAGMTLRRQRGEGGPTPRAYLTRLGSASLAALALTLPYWLPVLLESRYVLISQDAGSLGFVEHIRPLSDWVVWGRAHRYRLDGEPMFYLSVAQVLLLAVAGLITLATRFGARQAHRLPLAVVWLVTLGSLFLLTPASLPLWRALVVPYGLLQYPWRWQGITALGTALLVAAPLAWGRGTLLWRWVALPLIALLAFNSLSAARWQAAPVEPQAHPVEMWWEQDIAAGQIGATWTAEFLPLTVREQRWAIPRAPEPLPAAGERSPIRLLAASSDGFTLRAEAVSEERAWLSFPRFAYPSFRASVDGRPVPIEPRGLLGLAAVELPPGQHTVTLEAEPLAAHPWGARLLWLPWFALLAYALVRRDARRWLLVPLLVALPLLLFRVVGAHPYTVQSVAQGDLGDRVQLVGARLPAWSLRPGEALPVTMLWFNREQTATAYSSFVHLTPVEGGAPLLAHDREPNEGTVPTPRWLPGQLVEDLHLLRLPADLPAGRYALWGGMYEVADGQAVPLPGGDGARRLLGEIVVAP